MFPFQQFFNFAMNPNQMFSRMGLNIPNDISNNPQAIIQYMMNNGLISQQQYNFAVNKYNQLKKDPNVMQLFNNNSNSN